MELLFHASQTKDISVLEPRISNHGYARVYFSSVRENVFVYLSNAVEKYCKETGFEYDGVWKKWAPYGFDTNGILKIEEYYNNALYDTYNGVSGYVYSANYSENFQITEDIYNSFYSSEPVKVQGCEFIKDAYGAILEAEQKGIIRIERYGDMSENKRDWIKKIINKEYKENENHPEYRHFLKGVFADYTEE